MEHQIELLMSTPVTHHMKRFVFNRPRDFAFSPGQGVRAYLAARIEDFEQTFNAYGRPGFMDSVTAALKTLGARPQSLVFEE